MEISKVPTHDVAGEALVTRAAPGTQVSVEAAAVVANQGAEHASLRL